jgi:Gluconate 2-dehydrogenase subunit 3
VRGTWGRVSGWTRRGFLAWCSVALALLASGARRAAAARDPGGAGLDGHEEAILRALIGQIIPATGSPADTERAQARVLARIRASIGASGETLRAYQQGLGAMDAAAEKRHRTGFANLAAAQRFELLTWIDGTSDYYETVRAVVPASGLLKEWLLSHLPVRSVKAALIDWISWARGTSVQAFWRRVRGDVFDAFYSDALGLAWIGLDAAGMPVADPRHRSHGGGRPQ